MSEVKRWTAMYHPLGSLAGPEVATMVLSEDYDALKAENERLAAALDEARAELARAIAWKEDAVLRCAKRRCADRDRIQRETEAENARLREALQELFALVRGECPRLLDEDRDGDARLSIEIDAALSPQETTK
jgi:hypothetical protein